MARKRFQRYVYKRDGAWYGRWREDVIQASGRAVRVQKNIPIGSLAEYRTKQFAERAMQRLVFCVNDPGYRHLGDAPMSRSGNGILRIDLLGFWRSKIAAFRRTENSSGGYAPRAHSDRCAI